ncbi:hypothetical protein N0V82_006705 [Gnomoniopsis sp. IMI 355080]|nr:hypothetical protein N0V82_006705 [Gnomoniopsis sp. IMI 355080]
MNSASRSRALVAVLLAIPSLTSALAIHDPVWVRPRTSTSPEEIFGRDSTCGDSSYVQCAASLPSDFCCPSSSTCMALAGNTTALCCPTGGDCSQIEPIPCDITLEDKSKHPSATVMTSALTGTLETCGTKCCPFGYSCSDGVCNINSDQTAKPSTSSMASSSTTMSTQTSTGTQSAAVSPTSATDSSPTSTSTVDSGSGSSGSATVSSGADSTSTSSSDDTSTEGSSSSPASSANAGVVAGGVIGGIAGLALIGMIILFLVKRERRRKAVAEKDGDDANSRSSSSFGNIGPHPEISKPILSEGGTFRSDFTRKMSTRSPGSFHSGAGLRDGDDGASYVEEFDDRIPSMHEVPRSLPQQINSPPTRAVSSWYGTSYDPNDPGRQSEYQPPVKMPSARAFGGNDANATAGHNWLGDPLAEFGGPSASSRETGDDYINVFADSNALAPPPLDFGERRETRFSEFARQP